MEEIKLVPANLQVELDKALQQLAAANETANQTASTLIAAMAASDKANELHNANLVFLAKAKDAKVSANELKTITAKCNDSKQASDKAKQASDKAGKANDKAKQAVTAAETQLASIRAAIVTAQKESEKQAEQRAEQKANEASEIARQNAIRSLNELLSTNTKLAICPNKFETADKTSFMNRTFPANCVVLATCRHLDTPRSNGIEYIYNYVTISGVKEPSPYYIVKTLFNAIRADVAYLSELRKYVSILDTKVLSQSGNELIKNDFSAVSAFRSILTKTNTIYRTDSSGKLVTALIADNTLNNTILAKLYSPKSVFTAKAHNLQRAELNAYINGLVMQLRRYTITSAIFANFMHVKDETSLAQTAI